MVQEVTDPAILAQLNAPDPVTDPKILAQLNAPEPAAPEPGAFDNYLIGKGAFWDGVGKVVSQPSMQPFQNLGDYAGKIDATGDLTKDLIQTAKTIYEYPTRLLATAGLLSGPTADSVAEHAGALGVPAPISAALAIAAGAAVDPTSYLALKAPPVVKGGLEIPALAGEKAAARAASAEQFGIELTVGQARQSKALGYLEAMAQRYPFSADSFTNYWNKEVAQIDGVRAVLMKSLGKSKATEIIAGMEKTKITEYLKNATPEQAAVIQDKLGDIDAFMNKPVAGEFTKSMLAQQRKIAADAAGAEFEALKDVTPATTPTPGIKTAPLAKKFLKEELQADPVDQDAGWVKRLGAYAELDPASVDAPKSLKTKEWENYQRILREASAEQDPSLPQGPMTFGKAQATMRKLRDLRMKHDPGYGHRIEGLGDTYSGYAAQLRKALHDDMTSALDKLSDQAKKALEESPPGDPAVAGHLQQMTNLSERWKTAKQNWAKMKEATNAPFVVKLLKNDPEDFLNHAVTAKDVTQVGQLKDLLGPENFVPVQQNLIANMLVNKAGEFDPAGFAKKVDTVGYPTLLKVFEPETISEIIKSQQIFRDMTGMETGLGKGSPTMGLLVAKGAYFGTAVTAWDLLMSGHPFQAAGFTAGTVGLPMLAAKMYLSPAFRDIMLHAHTSEPAAAMALSVMAKGLAMSSDAGPRVLTNEPEPVDIPGTGATQ